jgi:hypothetical protein
LKDLLILSQAYIHTSENTIEGVSQKKNKFWDDVAEVFHNLKKQQEAFDSWQKKKKKYNSILLQNDFLSSNDNDDIEIIIPIRTSSSLQQKWSKFVLPLVTKFVSLTNWYPKLSGEGK